MWDMTLFRASHLVNNTKDMVPLGEQYDGKDVAEENAELTSTAP